MSRNSNRSQMPAPRVAPDEPDTVEEPTAPVETPAAPAAGLAGEDEYVRVQALDNPGTEFTIRTVEFNDAVYIRLDKPALDNHGEPAPPKYPANLPPAVPAADGDQGGQGQEPNGGNADRNSGDHAGDDLSQPGEAENGHQAENEGGI